MMTVLGNNVLLEPLPQQTKSAGGLLLASKYQDDQMRYRVLLVGPGRWVRKKGKPAVHIPIDVEPGDCVLAPPIHGNKLAFENVLGWLIVEADEIIAKWQDQHSDRFRQAVQVGIASRS